MYLSSIVGNHKNVLSCTHLHLNPAHHVLLRSSYTCPEAQSGEAKSSEPTGIQAILLINLWSSRLLYSGFSDQLFSLFVLFSLCLTCCEPTWQLTPSIDGCWTRCQIRRFGHCILS